MGRLPLHMIAMMIMKRTMPMMMMMTLLGLMWTIRLKKAAASEAILSACKAVGECLVCRFERLQHHREQQQQRYQQHGNGEPTASTKGAATETTKPKTTTKPNRITKGPLPQHQQLCSVFIILGLLLTFNGNKVSAGAEQVAVTFHKPGSIQLRAALLTSTTTHNAATSLSNNLIAHRHPPKKKRKNGVLAVVRPPRGNNNEVIYPASNEITKITPTSSSSSHSSIYPSSSLNDSSFSYTYTSTSSPNATYESEVPEIPAYIRSTAMVLCIVIMLMGVIGNVMVPIVIIRTKDMRNSTNIFLTNLSIADLLVLLVCTPTVLVELNTKPETWILGHELCKAVPFIELTVAHASVLTILAISFERYYAICEPLKAGYVCTKTRAILICSLAWGIAALFTSPILWVAEYKFVDYIDGSSVAVCLTQALSVWTVGYFLMTITVFFIFPLLILIVLYGVIAKNLISDTGPMMRIRPTKPEFSLKARKQVVLMLGAVVLSFFLCLLPFRLLTLWVITSSDQTILEIGVERYYNLLYFCRIMLYLNSAMNPILYNLMSTKFRKGFYKLICSVWIGLITGLTCGRYGAWRKRTGPGGVMATTTTTSSNTNTTTNTSSSILSRSSNRRSSDEICTRTRVQIQMQMPYGSDCEMVAMLHSNNTDCLPALKRYGGGGGVGSAGGVVKSHNHAQQRRSSLPSSAQTTVNASVQHSSQHHNHHVVCSRLKMKQISYEEEEAVVA